MSCDKFLCEKGLKVAQAFNSFLDFSPDSVKNPMNYAQRGAYAI